jgi:AraC-like DNA-binding protein
METTITSRLSFQLQLVVKSVKEHIDAHPLDRGSMDDFCSLAGINRKTLQRSFKQEYGVCISDHQLLKRMEAAADMLRNSRLSQKQIAARCGYHKANNFSRAFKKVYKCAPTAWQNECGAQMN